MKQKTIRLLSIILVILSFMGTGLTYAYLQAYSDKLENTFTNIKDSNVVINETFNGSIKSDVDFDVNSDIDSYIRVKLVFNFLDEDENIISKKPKENEDYTISINPEWKYLNGYYYLEKPIQDNKTPILISDLRSINNNYKLSVDILAQVTSDPSLFN